MIIVDTPDLFFTMLSDLCQSDILFCDTEATGLNPRRNRLLLFQAYNRKNNYVVDFVKLDLSYAAQLNFIMQSSSILKVFHNATFDIQMLKSVHVDVKHVHCTMIADQQINAGLYSKYSLADVAERRLGIVVDKSIREQFINRDITIPFTTAELEYAALDVDLLEPIYDQQIQEIAARRLDKVREFISPYELESKLIPVTASMEYTGIRANKERLLVAGELAEALYQRASVGLQDEFIASGVANQIVFSRDGYLAVLPSSNPQMLAAFNALDIDVKSLQGGELAEWDAFWAIKNNIKIEQHDVIEEDDEVSAFHHPLLKKHDIRSTAAKLKGTFIDGILKAIDPDTQRIYPHFNQCGAAATGRYSSSSINFQNIIKPDKVRAIGLDERCFIRPMFEASPGYAFIIADYSGIELAILAIMSGDERLIQEVGSGDVHSFVANNLEGDKIERVLGSKITPKNKKTGSWETVRDSFKKINYSVAYGTTEHGIYRKQYNQLASVGFIITMKDTKRWLDTWKYDLFPGTGAWLNQNAENAVTRRYTESVLGRRRFWPEEIRFDKWRSLAAMREGMNQPIQSSSADMTKTALYLIHSRLNPREARIVATVHDEIIVEAKIEKAETLQTLVKDTMIEAGYLLFPRAQQGLILVDAHVSSRYDK